MKKALGKKRVYCAGYEVHNCMCGTACYVGKANTVNLNITLTN